MPLLHLSRRFGWIICLLLPTACGPDTSTVPSTSGDHRVFISLQNQVLAEGGVDKPEIETFDSCSATGGCAVAVHAPRHTRITLVGKAVDPIAGIKALKLTVARGATTLLTAQATYAIDAGGKALGEVGFVGSDNAGSFGVQVPLVFAVSDYTTVTIEATNFENNVNKLIADYVPHDPVQAHISVSPTRIRLGGEATLQVSGSHSSTLVISPSLALHPWPITVSPTMTTTYSLTVTQPFPQAKIGFPNPPPALGQTVHYTSATETATLTVDQPPPPVANPAKLAFYLHQQPLYLGTNIGFWNEFGLNTTGSIVAIQNQGPYTIELISDAGSTDDCFMGSPLTVPLAPLQETSMGDISTLYGTAATYPRDILACAVATPPPQSLTVIVTYTH